MALRALREPSKPPHQQAPVPQVQAVHQAVVVHQQLQHPAAQAQVHQLVAVQLQAQRHMRLHLQAPVLVAL